jgi:hypothetical protein
MDMFIISNDLQPGAIVNIYTDYKFQRKFEGRAKLIERKEKGLTFMLYNENLLTILENRAIDPETGAHMPFTKEQKENNKLYARLTVALKGTVRSGVRHVNEHIHNLYLLLKEEVNSDLENPKYLWKVLEHYEKEWNIYSDERGLFFNQFRKEDIIRYVQQTCLKDWCHSIWREERWLVEFLSDGYSSPFKTHRKIRTLICINPNEDGQNSDILHYTTKENSLISNADRKELREKEKEEEDIAEETEDTVYTEDELEFITQTEAEVEEFFTNLDQEALDVYETTKVVSLEEAGILNELEDTMSYEMEDFDEEPEEEDESFTI